MSLSGRKIQVFAFNAKATGSEVVEGRSSLDESFWGCWSESLGIFVRISPLGCDLEVCMRAQILDRRVLLQVIKFVGREMVRFHFLQLLVILCRCLWRSNVVLGCHM